MKNTKRSAFTIVELVIVIAVIAILSAVLIPTFGGIIKSANIAADQSAAATLTTELQIWLKGGKVDGEEKLLEGMNAIDPDGKKFVPKALSYGYHFWFDMETQMFISGSAEEVADMGEPTDYPDSMRHIYGNGYFLADSAETINQMFGNFADITVDNYAEYFAKVEAKVEDRNYSDIAARVLANLKKTVIVNNNGIFFYSGPATMAIDSANSVWFAPGLELITAKHYEFNGTDAKAKEATSGLPAVSEFKLPASVLLVEANALDFIDASTEINLGKKVGDSYGEILNVFAPKSTNAIIVDSTGRQFQITVGDGIIADEGADILVEIVDGVQVFCDYLIPKAPFDEWEIGYGLTDNAQKANADSWIIENSGVLYFAYGAKAEVFIKDANGNKSYSVKSWETSDENIAKVSGSNIVMIGNGEVTLTATVINLYGEETQKSFTFVVNKPNSANITMNNMSFRLDGATYEINWQYGSANAYLLPTVIGNISYTNSATHALGTNGLTITFADPNGSLKLNSEGKIVRDGEKTADAIFTVTVDGCLETTFKVSIIDNTKSPVRVNYYDDSNGDVYRYYIGDKNTVTLGDLFRTKNPSYDLSGASLTIYDTIDGDGVLWPFDEFDEGIDVEYSGDNWTLGSDWKSETLKFTRHSSYVSNPEEYFVYVKITPKNGDSPLFVRVHIVDGTNISYAGTDAATVTAVNNALADSNSGIVVLQTSFTMVTGQTLNIGAKTLYGNGYVITADKYVADLIADNKVKEEYNWCSYCETYLSNCKTDLKDKGVPQLGMHGSSCNSAADYSKTVTIEEYHYYTNVAMIEIGDGTINNIYINGPVYPDLQYVDNDCMLEDKSNHYKHSDIPYYVSGIKITGSSTISNSYIKGFRSPVLVAGDAAVGSLVDFTNANGVADKKAEIVTPADNATFINTVLHGGNYANLIITSGNVTLNDVTTIQDFEGMTPTVGYESTDTFKVTGVGILMESSAVAANDILVAATEFAKQFVANGHGDGTSTAVENKLGLLVRPLSTKIDINGNFTQYNWIEKNRENIKLPTVPVHTGAEVEVEFILDTIFNGVELYGFNLGRMGRFMHLTHQDVPVGDGYDQNRITTTKTTSDKNELVNLGIIFIDIEQASGDPVTRAAYAQYFIHIDESGSTSRKHSTASLELAEDISVDIPVIGTVDATIITDGANASFTVWSYADGRAWYPYRDGLQAYADVIPESTNWNNVHVVTDNDRYYGGYYATSDAYKTEYAWEINK